MYSTDQVASVLFELLLFRDPSFSTPVIEQKYGID